MKSLEAVINDELVAKCRQIIAKVKDFLQKSIPLECKNYVKYLGVLIDSNLSWRYHIDHISSKISKGVGIIARLRHFVPTNTFVRIYPSFIEPYISYGLTTWVQAENWYLNKVLILRSNFIHSHYTRFSAVGNFQVQGSRTNQQLLSFSRTGTRIWNKIPPKLSKLSETLFNGNY